MWLYAPTSIGTSAMTTATIQGKVQKAYCGTPSAKRPTRTCSPVRRLRSRG